MNELFSNEPNELRFYCRVKASLVTPTQTPTATLFVDDIETPLTVRTISEGVFGVPVKSNDIKTKSARVEFKYELPDHGEVVDSQKYEISRRIVSYDEVAEALDGEVNYKDYAEIERTARGMIEAHCRQPFSYWYGSDVAVGNDGLIMLPQYLDKLEYVEKKLSEVNAYHISFSEDGYEVASNGMAIQNYECLEQQKYMQASPRQSDYIIRGQWGYETLPMPIKQAALLLIQNKLCPSGVWHENYIDNLRSDNMRIQYNPESYIDSTGNYDADQLLTDYRNITIGAI